MSRTAKSKRASRAMDDLLLEELIAARRARTVCAVITVAATTGSVPREPGSKMIVYGDGKTRGTIGGGKFESLVATEAITAMREKKPVLKTYPLHEGDACSFGAICGGEVTILIEPQILSEALFLAGAGHCARAIAKLAIDCGLFVTVVDDRAELLTELPALVEKVAGSPTDFIRKRKWNVDEALVLVSRNYEHDRDALQAALTAGGAGYIGMIGSQRKVRHVFDELREQGVSKDALARVYAPLGFDIGADSPAEIAVSAVAEILSVLRKKSGDHFRAKPK